MQKEQEGPPESPNPLWRKYNLQEEMVSFMRLGATTGRVRTLFSWAQRKGLSCKVCLLLPEAQFHLPALLFCVFRHHRGGNNTATNRLVLRDGYQQRRAEGQPFSAKLQVSRYVVRRRDANKIVEWEKGQAVAVRSCHSTPNVVFGQFNSCQEGTHTLYYQRTFCSVLWAFWPYTSNI